MFGLIAERSVDGLSSLYRKILVHQNHFIGFLEQFGGVEARFLSTNPSVCVVTKRRPILTKSNFGDPAERYIRTAISRAAQRKRSYRPGRGVDRFRSGITARAGHPKI